MSVRKEDSLIDDASAQAGLLMRPQVSSSQYLPLNALEVERPTRRIQCHEAATVIGGLDLILTKLGDWKGIDGSQRSQPPEIPRRTAPVVLDQAVFGCFIRPQNWAECLFGLLPHLELATRRVPAGTQILVDAALSETCCWALEKCFPGFPLRKVETGDVLEVRRLYVANAGNIEDRSLVAQDMAFLERLRDNRRDKDSGYGKRILLWSQSSATKLRNAKALRAVLEARGFVTLDPSTLPLEARINALADARDVILVGEELVGDALLAGGKARIFPFVAVGSDLHFWSLIAELGGKDLTVILGAAPYRRLHHRLFPQKRTLVFHVDPHLVLPFFADESQMDQKLTLREFLDRLYGASFEADVLTGAWAVRAGPTPLGFEDRLRHLRRSAALALEGAGGEEIEEVFDHAFFTDFGRNLRSGFPVLGGFEAAEAALAGRVAAALAQVAERSEGLDAVFAGPVGLRRLVMLGMVLLPAWQVPLPKPHEALPEAVLERWIFWAMSPPALIGAGEDAAWVSHVERLLDWLADRLDPAAEPAVSAALSLRLSRMAGRIDLGQLFLVDQSLRGVQRARNRVLSRVALREDGNAPASGKPTSGSDKVREAVSFQMNLLRRHVREALATGQWRPLLGVVKARLLDRFRSKRRGSPVPSKAAKTPSSGERRIRVGVLCRTFEKGPDSEAVLTFFNGFDASRFEIFGYSIGFRDRVVSKDPGFDRQFDAVVPNRRDLPGDAAGIRAALLADDLDVFLYANATTYGLQPMDLALFHRVAPLQIVLNSHVPMPMGYPSFDAVITGQSDHSDHEVPQEDFSETLIRLPGPVINYLTTLEPRPNPPLDRAALGLSADDVVLMNAGSSMKLRHETLVTMMRATRDIPNGVLLLAPYNPGWAARSMAFVFNRQVAQTAAETGLDPSRIHILGELSVAEAEAALGCADIYLNPFPHGGATMTHLALVHGIPPITLRRRSTRSIDQFLTETHGFAELLTDTPEDYIALATALGTDHDRRNDLKSRLKAAAKNPGFVNNPIFSKNMEQALSDLISVSIREGQSC
ncbi:hypothetical protein ACSBLW_14420 [Thioclava sp. FR2]|uniref:O-linked N-acetylglucosamine transferase family protein n=1 Tax=Thioclava sp. FR2 TaxID=3445780 RepID=UPI003EBB4815